MVTGNEETETVDLAFEVSPAFKLKLEELAQRTGDSVGDVLIKSLVLMGLAVDAKEQGKHLAVTGKNSSVEITGI